MACGGWNLLRPIYECLSSAIPRGICIRAMRRGGLVFVPMEGKEGYGPVVVAGQGPGHGDLILPDPSRGHTVVENHFGAQSRGVLVVDRYVAYQAMIWVKDGVIVLAFWSHVRRDFIRVGKGWPELKTWALDWVAADSPALPAQ